MAFLFKQVFTRISKVFFKGKYPLFNPFFHVPENFILDIFLYSVNFVLKIKIFKNYFCF